MRTIVESIQKEQDLIIRDTENQLLLVQGSAGSGKTSIALRRIACLLYEGLNSSLRSDNIIIISPNDVFSQYISSVLPELGEENVPQATYDDIVARLLGSRIKTKSREDYLESMIAACDPRKAGCRGLDNHQERAGFKGSETFRRILDRWLDFYGRKLIPFEDVFFNGKVLATRQELKNRFLHNQIGVPMAKQLAKIESMLLPLSHPYKKERLERIKQIVARSEGRAFEIRPFSRLLAIKESQAFRQRIRKFTSVDYCQIYRRLFCHRGFITAIAENPGGKLGQDSLPLGFLDYMETTNRYLQQGEIKYEDYAALLYLKLRVEGSENVSDIKQVVIDEAQDYSPLQYHVFKHLYGNANFTVLGDTNQSISEEKGPEFYRDIIGILDKEKALQLSLRQSYRSTMEIQAFTQKLLVEKLDTEPFSRSGTPPDIAEYHDTASLHQAIASRIKELVAEGLETVAVVCKTQAQAADAYSDLRNYTDIRLVCPQDRDFSKGPLVISTVMAKGLEFDAVIIYNANQENYRTELDRRLLYIACTRALHRLSLFYTGDKSPLITDSV
jgi:DNA helicase-2/ATP-dependent DNA helicase PcrA